MFRALIVYYVAMSQWQDGNVLHIRLAVVMLLIGLIGTLYEFLQYFPFFILVMFGTLLIGAEVLSAFRRNGGLEYYAPFVHKVLFQESLFDLLYNRNYITRFMRMWVRFLMLVTFRSDDDEVNSELLNGMDDTFIHRVFSPGLLSLVKPTSDDKRTN